MVDATSTNLYGYATSGQLWTEDGPWASDTVTNTYNNRLRTGLSLAQPTGSWTNAFRYDGAKRLTNVTSMAGAFDYYLGAAAAASPLAKKIALPNTAYITNTYDSVARLTGTWLKTSTNGILDSATYGYNAAHQRTTFTNAAGTYVQFTNDAIGQLKVADSSVNSEDRRYVYDAAWNLNFRTNNTTLSTFKVDNKNQLTNATPVGTQTYDANGNVTFVTDPSNGYYYDDENRLANWIHYDGVYDGSGQPTHPGDYRTEFVYDGKGRLRKRVDYTVTFSPPFTWVWASETRYLYDGMRVIQERDTNNTPLVSYTRGTDLSGSLEGAGGIGGMLARSHGYASTNGNWYTHNCYHADGNGNITYLVNSSQALAGSYRYDPFGNTTASSGTLATANVYRFSSKEFHANSGLYYYVYRWYAPSLQRWVNRDPIHEVGSRVSARRARGWREKLELNLFAFVRNRPLGLVDLFGLADWGAAGGTCCNKSTETQWALVGQPGQWVRLDPGRCTGFWDDCDGMTCGGGFYYVNNFEHAACTTPGTDSPSCASRRWTPNNPGPNSQPPGPPARPGRPGGEHRGAPTGHEPPPHYPWSDK